MTGRPAGFSGSRRSMPVSGSGPSRLSASTPAARSCRRAVRACLENSGSDGRVGVFKSSCLSHICRQLTVAWGWSGENPSSAMPRPPHRTLTFEPNHIQAMRKAFDAVCARLELSAGREDQATELVALKIIELARAGDGNAETLAARARRVRDWERRVVVAALDRVFTAEATCPKFWSISSFRP